jgi:hypothetical protein
VVTDPVIGTLSDRLTTRFGRRRPWLLAGAPFVMVSAGYLFLPGPGADWGSLLVWTMVLYLGATMILGSRAGARAWSSSAPCWPPACRSWWGPSAARRWK